jgi:hypothetical protein
MNKTTINTTIIAILVVSVLLIAGCSNVSTVPKDDNSKSVDSDKPTTPKGNTQMANPASVNCKEKGGTLSIVTDSTGGQIGICNFPDGTSCEEWALYRGECTTENATKECGECPMLSPPGPDFCKDGVLVSGGTDACGCNLPPKCDTSGGKGTTPKACTEEAKVCPDGSAVGRTGPNCEFSACPAAE